MSIIGKFQPGNVELTEDEAAGKGAKIRISIMIDEDILDHFRAKAEAMGGKYQTLMNHALRSAMGKSKDNTEAGTSLEEFFKLQGVHIWSTGRNLADALAAIQEAASKVKASSKPKVTGKRTRQAVERRLNKPEPKRVRFGGR